MIDQLLKSLFAPAPARLPEPDARVALTGLLVRIAKSDGHFDAVERATICDVIAARFGLTDSGVVELMAEAEDLEARAPDTVTFTEAIKNTVDYGDRLSVVEAAWAVVLADGERADEEDALMRLIAKFLGVSDMESNMARKRAEQAG